MQHDVTESNALVLAAEDFDDVEFQNYHYFTSQDKRCISKLRAHGPVLLKGARGSGKSALMIEAVSGLFPANRSGSAIGIYVSLRNLDLLRASGSEYIELFCSLVVNRINSTLGDEAVISGIKSVSELQSELTSLSSRYGKRLVLLFDDAAHIGREMSLSEFFDIFRTLSNSSISCKASIYPGVTRFGTRFDVYNDATVIEVNRSESADDFSAVFEEVINRRFSESLPGEKFSSALPRHSVSKFLGISVLGNMRAFIYACNQLVSQVGQDKVITVTHLSEALKALSQNYFWPLLEEVAPKLGMYRPMVGPAEEVAELLFERSGAKGERSVIILREIAQRLSKPLEILEYSGFLSRKEVSRSMKSRGRGTRYILNLCNVSEFLDKGKVMQSNIDKWMEGDDESIEFHRGSELFDLNLPEVDNNDEIDILKMDIDSLKQSNAYPYGLTDSKIEILKENNICTIEDLVMAKDEFLISLPTVGEVFLKRFRSTANQAIWM
ncbi:ATP-binding protein [Ferrimonas sediminicola]|uniref:ATP-binding protein n=1 Tax=Ferrimonas sediminicola TaxID=2569538 RepID=A0A4U1B828_9GAMM|nr:ATP-binding protein [Ferrimonas sediminicola]TKB46776.1 ATP-binding protein [Ferrimonas sediminicola]